MSIDIEVLGEAYTILKQYIPVKDRQEAADNLMSVMVDMLNDVDLAHFSGTDGILTKAFKEYVNDDDNESIEDENEY